MQTAMSQGSHSSRRAHRRLQLQQDRLVYRPRRGSGRQLATCVQTYLVLSPLLEQTSILSGWIGKLLALSGKRAINYWIRHTASLKYWQRACLGSLTLRRLRDIWLYAKHVVCMRQTCFAGAYMLAQALLSFKRWGDETKQAGRFFAVFAALLVELTIDNAFTWYYLCKLRECGILSSSRMA